MTIAVSVKVHDGLVFASDSAGTFSVNGMVTNVYNNLNKVFNLHKKLPIAGMMYGSANIGRSSVGTLAKDLRKRFTLGHHDEHGEWKIDASSYTIEGIAQLTWKFFNQCLERETPEFKKGWEMGFFVGGFSASKDLAELWHMKWADGICQGPILRRACEDTATDVEGMPEPIHRLIHGYGSAMPSILLQLGLKEELLAGLLKEIQGIMSPQFEQAAMPIQDAIDLAEFYAQTAVAYWRFHPGAAKSVGGPIEIAAITKHEGFAWIKRKHYFNMNLNAHKELT